MYPQQIIDALRHVRYPGTGKDLIESGMLEDDIRISGFEVSFSLIFQKDNDPFMKSVVKAAETALQTYIDPNVSANIHTKFVKTQPTANSQKELFHLLIDTMFPVFSLNTITGNCSPVNKFFGNGTSIPSCATGICFEPNIRLS